LVANRCRDKTSCSRVEKKLSAAALSKPSLPDDPDRTLPKLRIELPTCLWNDYSS
jgi:hypothetical protein